MSFFVYSFNFREYVRQGGLRSWAKLLEESAYGAPRRLMQESKERKRKIAGIRRRLLFELRLLFFSQRPQKPLKRLLPFVRSYTFIWATAYKIFYVQFGLVFSMFKNHLNHFP